MAETTESGHLTELVADIVGAYVSNNKVAVNELPGIISQVHAALQSMAGGAEAPQQEAQQPAVPVRRSVNPDYILCLEDGKKFKSLKRHLRTDHDMTPQEYRQKWGLKPDYPMVAPNYAASRSELAKKMGLGRKPAEDAGAQQKKRGGRPRREAAGT